ncbi:MAG: hypothetical protein CMJ81_15895 [Planctomycetaceae bacterium]|nr:hypothetical protein [Planctomycetaceae bacterium]MBP62316.1 hypothetical protein [Planctomycetaceae bacterium]
MSSRCIALLSGGLDSILAIRLMQQQGLEVEAINFKTTYTCCQDAAGQSARDLGVRLTVLGQDDDYLQLIKHPAYGRGKGANPCVDCRIYMFKRARDFAEQNDAQFIVSGEVVGQRPMSQKRRDLDIIADKSGLEDLLLRPLSAKLLPPTWPERAGIVDRSQLFAFNGRSRKGLIRLARHLEISNIPPPSTGCALTEVKFSQKVYDLVRLDPEAGRWNFELLKHGRHFRYDQRTKIVIGRNETDNHWLEYMHDLPDRESTVKLVPEAFPGPLGLIVGPPQEATIQYAGALLLKHAKGYDPDDARITVHCKQRSRVHRFQRMASADEAQTVAS